MSRKKIKSIISFIALVFTTHLSLAQSDLELGYQYYEDGEYDKAIEYLEPLVKTNQSNQMYKSLFNSYLSVEDHELAEDLTKKFLKKSRLNKMELYTNLIYINRLAKDDKGVKRAFRNLENKVKNNPSLAYSAGDALQKRGYPKMALDIYDVAQTSNPKMNLDYQKAQLYGELGDIKKMYSMYVEMVERTPNYLPSVKNLIAQGLNGFESSDTEYLKETIIKKIQSGGPQTMNELLIFVYIQEENFSGAFAQLKALDRRSKSNKAEIFNLGYIAFASEEYTLSVRIFDYVIKAGKENPFYEEALLGRLKAKNKNLVLEGENGKNTWAVLQGEYFKVRKQVIGTTQMGELTISLANITAFRLDDVDSAIGLLKDLLSVGYIGEDEKARAKIALGDILLYNGNRWEAIIYYGQAEKAFEKSPIGQEAKFKRAKAAYYVGDFQWAQGIFDALKASTSKLIANDAMKYSLLINDNIALDTTMEAMKLFAKADLFNYQKNQDSALIVLDQLQAQYPGHTVEDETLLLKSEIWTEKREFNKAADNLQMIIDNHSDDILADDAIYRLAQLFERHLNRTSEAQELYQRLFTEHPDSFFTSDARKRYRQLRGDILN